MIKWDDLRYLLAVARTGSFLAAGKRLKVDRTTVARRIDALEQALGCQLFVHTDMQFQLTEIGRTVLAAAERMDDAASPLEALRQPSPIIEGIVRLAVPASLGDAFIADLVAFHALHPLVSIEVSNVSDPISCVAARKADLGIGMANERPARLDALLLGRLQVAVYAAARHADEVGQAWVGRSEDVPKAFADWMSEYAPAAARITTRVNSWDALKSAVLSSGGMAPLWCLLADAEAGLFRVTQPNADQAIGLWLSSLEGAKRDAAQQAAWRFLAERLPGRLAG